MNKRYLPAIAAILIALTATTFVPVFAQLPTRLIAQPTLTVVTIAQDDQKRQTGVLWMAPDRNTYLALLGGAAILGMPSGLMSQFKLFVSYNGVPIAPTGFYCEVIEKDKYNPIKDKQFPTENLFTAVKDESGSFVCKARWGKPGVGVLDVYYVGPGLPVNIADYVLDIGVWYTVGRTLVWGSDIQDICLLGWPVPAAPAWIITKPDGTLHYIYADPLGGWKSCEDLALMQKAQLGIPIPWT
jgi:hypothetical protein